MSDKEKIFGTIGLSDRAQRDLQRQVDQQAIPEGESYYLMLARGPGEQHVALIDASAESPIDLAATRETADKLLLQFAVGARPARFKKDSDPIHDRATAVIRGSTEDDHRYIALLSSEHRYSRQEFIDDVKAVGSMLRDMGVSPRFPDIKVPYKEKDEKQSIHRTVTKMVTKATASLGAVVKGKNHSGDEGSANANVEAEAGAQMKGEASAEWMREKVDGHTSSRSYETLLNLPGDAGTVLAMIQLSERLGLPSPRDIRKACKFGVNVDELVEKNLFSDMQTEIKAVEIGLTQLAVEILEKRLKPEPDYDDLKKKTTLDVNREVVDEIRRNHPQRLEFQAVIDQARHGFVGEASGTLSTIINPHYEGSSTSQTDETLAFNLLSMATYYKGLSRTLNQSLASYAQDVVGDSLTVFESHDYQVEPGDRVIAGTRSASPKGKVESMLCEELGEIHDVLVVRRGDQIIITDSTNPETGASETTHRKWKIARRQSFRFDKDDLKDPVIKQTQRNAMGSPAEMPLYQSGLARLRQVRAAKGFDESQDRKFNDEVLAMSSEIKKRMLELTDGNGFGFEGRTRGEAPSLQ